MTTLAFGLASQAQAKNTVAFSFLIRETVLLNITKIRHFLRQPAGTKLGQETDTLAFFFFFPFCRKSHYYLLNRGKYLSGKKKKAEELQNAACHDTVFLTT